MIDVIKVLELTLCLYILQWGLFLGRKRAALWGRPSHKPLSLLATAIGSYFLFAALVGWYTPLIYTEYMRFILVLLHAGGLLFGQRIVLDWFIPNKTPEILEALPLAVVVWADTDEGVFIYSANARARRNAHTITGEALKIPTPADEVTIAHIERSRTACGPVVTEFGWAGRVWEHVITPMRPGFFVSIYYDVTEVHMANEGLRRTNEDLEAFAFSASHDLTEPLRNITQWTEALFEDYGDRLQEPEALEMRGFITEGVVRMRRLISGLLTFHRAGQVGDMVEVELQDVIDTAIANLENPITLASAEIYCQPGAPSVRGDNPLLVKVFQNVLSNSIKYRNEGEVPHITISHRTDPGVAVIIIEDDGIGTAINQQHKVFKMFGRSADHLDYSGQGFGLTLVRRLVHEHGGTVDYESEGTGHGSTVTIRLPLAKNALPNPTSTPR